LTASASVDRATKVAGRVLAMFKNKFSLINKFRWKVEVYNKACSQLVATCKKRFLYTKYVGKRWEEIFDDICHRDKIRVTEDIKL
jgi:hypothetical protein